MLTNSAEFVIIYHMNGIYILKTSDGYRVAYSDRYYSLVDIVEDECYNIRHKVNGKVAAEVFSNSKVFENYESALKQAKITSQIYEETDDGICLISYAQNINYGDLIETPSGC